VRENAIRQESELRMAEGVQKTMIPGANVVKNGVHTHAIFRAASECAGDWWGRFSLSEDEELVVLADVTGHGAHSALVGALAYGYFSTLESNHVLNESKLGPEKLLSDLNRILFKAGKGSLTLTAVAVLINRRTKEVKVASAAHCQAELIRSSSCTGIKAKGDLIGLAPKFSATEYSFFHEPSDLIFLYTDGLLECTGVNGKMLSKKSLRKLLTEEDFADRHDLASHGKSDDSLSSPAEKVSNLNVTPLENASSDLAQMTYSRLKSFVSEHFEDIHTSDDISALLISFDQKEVKK
jgi:sigma-B regulation protein RsbU (phosphoserine phosphatase)